VRVQESASLLLASSLLNLLKQPGEWLEEVLMRSNIGIAMRVVAALLVSGLSVLACSGEVKPGGDKQGSSGDCTVKDCEVPPDPIGTTPDTTPCSVLDVQGTIPGVSLSIKADRCVYHVGEAAEFTYEVKTDASVPPIESEASVGCGDCSPPSEDPLSFMSYSIGGVSQSGQMQHYCLCDIGCCAPNEATTTQLPATTASAKIQWSGKNWSGPSDTGSPQGEFFPPGKYDVEVSFSGNMQGSVTAKLPIEIIP
jgi:hypothetical protein